MALLELDAPETNIEAESAASKNWEANVRALGATQPALTRSLARPGNLNWMFARDGFLSAKAETGGWISTCSLPMRAAAEMMKEMKLHTGVACFVCPTHAAQLHVALESARSNQSVIAIVESLEELAIILNCHDFSSNISEHRVFFAAGPEWSTELDKLLTAYTGLPTPGTFIRLVTTPQEVNDRVMAAAQSVFSTVASNRAKAIQQYAQRRTTQSKVTKQSVCLVASSQFRLWDDAGHTLATVAGSISKQVDLRRVDPDNPADSSPLAVAMAASKCTSLLAANFTRADAPQVLAHDVPWITWLTTQKIPSHVTAGPNDQLLLADAKWVDQAVLAGWPRDQVHVATWPTMSLAPATTNLPLAIIADTSAVPTSPAKFDLSSHTLLWELIYNELKSNPFLLGEIGRYLNQRIRRVNIAEENFDHRRFIEELILPLYQQGIARAILSAKLPLTIHGKGWSDIPEFAECAAGPISDRAAFEQAMQDCSALIDVWPASQAACKIGRPVIRHTGSLESLVRSARSIDSQSNPTLLHSASALSGPLLASIMGLDS